MYDKESRKWLYDQLTGAGYNIGTLDGFTESLSDKTNRDWYYDRGQEMGLELGTREQFKSAMVGGDSNGPNGNVFTASQLGLEDSGTEQPKQEQPAQKPKQTTQSVNTQQPAQATTTPPQVASFKPLDLKALNTWKNPMGATAVEREQQQYSTKPKEDTTISDTITALKGGGKNPTPGVKKAQEKIKKAAAQMRDRFDYEMATGEELPQFGGGEVFAHQLNRDDEGNIMFGEDGMPTLGITSDPTRVGAEQRLREQREEMAANNPMRQAKELLDAIDAEMEKPREHLVNDPEWDKLVEAREKILDTIRNIELERQGGSKGFWNGVGNAFKYGKLWAFGVDKLADAMQQYDIYSKMRDGKELTNEEKLLAQAFYNRNASEAKLDEDSNFLYRAGRMTAEMLPFAASIYLTGGGAGIAEAVMKGVNKYIPEGANAATRYFMKATGAILGDMLGGAVMANTVGLPKTAADIMQGRMGHLEYNPDGQLEYVGGKSWLKSGYQGEIGNILEYSTELMGEHLLDPFFKKVLFGSGKLGSRVYSLMEGKMGKEATEDFVKFLKDSYKGTSKAGLQGLPSEGLEEEINNVLSIALHSDDNAVENFKSLQNHLDIWGGMALSLPFMHGASMGLQGAMKTYDTTQYYRYKRKVDQSGIKASGLMGDEAWSQWQERIDNTSNEDMGKVYADVISEARKKNIGEKAAYAAIDYMNNLMAMRGYNQGRWHLAMQNAKDGKETDNPTPVESAVVQMVQAEDEGYNTTDSDAMRDAQATMVARQEMLEEQTDEGSSLVAMLDKDPIGGLKYVAENYSGTPGIISAAQDYVNSRMKWLGMTQRVNDEAGLAAQQAADEIDDVTNKDTGMVQTATLKHTGEQVYIVGSINESDVLVRNAQTGEVSISSMSQLTDIGEPQDAEQLKKAAEAAAREGVVTAEQDKMNGTLSMQVGDTYTITDENDVQHQVTILEDKQNGVLAVEIDGKKTNMTKESLQQLADEDTSLRIRKGIEQEQQAEQEKKEQLANGQAEGETTEMPMIGEGEEAEPDYMKASPSRTHEYIYNESGLDKEEADEIVANNLADAEAELEAIEKNKPKPDRNPKKFSEQKKAWQAQVDEARKKVEYWSEVAKQELTDNLKTAEAVAEAVQAPEQVAGEKPVAEKQEPVMTAEEKEEKRREPLRQQARSLSRYLGKKVHLLESIDEVESEMARNQIEEADKQHQFTPGWIDQKTGEVYIYLPHAQNAADVERTFFHEVVSHFGLKGLMGSEKYGKFCLNVFDNAMSKEDKEDYLNYPGVKGIKDETKRKMKAADEYLAYKTEVTNIDKDMSVWKRILAAIRYATGYAFSHINENDILYAMKGSYDRLRKNVAMQTTNSGIETADGNEELGFSTSAIAEGAGLEASTVDDQGNKFPLTDENGNAIFKIGNKVFDAKHPITADDLKKTNSAFNYIAKMSLDASKYTGMTQKKLDTMYNQYAAILNTYLAVGTNENGGGAADLMRNWLWLGDTVYRTIATNGDKQYSYSSDITRVCKKNEAVIKTISELQKRLGYGITPAQIMDIYAMTQQEGYQVPCPVCYVFSRYIRNGKYASTAINGMRKYGKHLPGGNDPWTLEQWQAEYERLNYQKSASDCKERLDEAKVKKNKKEIAKWEKAYNDAKAAEKALKSANEVVTKVLGDIDSEKEKLGEIDKLGRQLALEKNEKERKKIQKKIDELDRKYRAALNVISQQSLTNWIKSFAIQSVKGQWQLREDAQKPEDMQAFEDVALDLRKTSTAITKYPGIQRLRNSGGSAAGKEITFASNNEVGELVSGVNTSEPGESVNFFKEAADATDPNEKKELEDKAEDRFSNATKYAKRQTLRGGQRMWSWSDNIEELMPDVVINLFQMELLGGAVQAYSKQLEGINLVASMGGYVNGSLMAKDNGWKELTDDEIETDEKGNKVLKNDITDTIVEVDPETKEKKPRPRVLAQKGSPVSEVDGKNVVLMFDDVIGIDAFGKDGKEGLFSLNAKLDKAGNILVGMNDTHVKAALADKRIFFVIPWHASGQSQHILQQMLGLLGTNLEGFVSTDYTNMQEEKNFGTKKKDGKYPEVTEDVIEVWETHKNETDFKTPFPIESGKGKWLSKSQQDYRHLREMIFDGTIEDDPKAKKQVMEDEFLNQVYEYVQTIPEDGNGRHTMTSTDNDYVYPYEYWDRNSTYETADKNGARYAEYCRRLGILPKFSGEWKGGKRSTEAGNFIDSPGYWKLLIDRRMYGNDKYFQDLTPIDSEGFSPEMISHDYNDARFPLTEVATDKGVVEIADKVQELETERTGTIPQVDYDMTMGEAINAFNDARGNKGRNTNFATRESMVREPEGDVSFRVGEAYTQEEIERIVGSKLNKNNYGLVEKINPFRRLLWNTNKYPIALPYRDVFKTPTLEDYYIGTTVKFESIGQELPEEPNGEDRASAYEANKEMWQKMKDSGKYEWHKSPLSSSEYLIDRSNGDIYRFSDHWGRVASCSWTIDQPQDYMYQIGKANIKDFKPKRTFQYFANNPEYNPAWEDALTKTISNYEKLLDSDVEMTDSARKRVEKALSQYRELLKTYKEKGEARGSFNSISFRITEPAPIFVSNAKRAVDGIKQDKATPEQWLAMITKNGGLKAGEDKWMGLSDWLKNQDKKTLTKEEVLDYIRKNQIEDEDYRKQEQFDIIQESNPMHDDIHTGIRSADDINTFEEALDDYDYSEDITPDYTADMVKEAIESGKVTIYSSYPIENGVFVTPSKMEAQNYAGDGEVYSKQVPVDDVAWIDPVQGQYAPIENEEEISFSFHGGEGQPATLKAALAEGLIKLANANEENRSAHMEAMENVNEDMKDIARKLAKSQKKMDKSVIEGLVDYTKMLLKQGFFAQSSAYEVMRLVNNIEKAASKEEVREEARKISAIITNNMIRTCKNIFAKQMSVKAKRTNQKGVEVIGKLSIEGQRIIEAMKEGMLLDSSVIADRISELNDIVSNETDELKRKNAELKLQGYQLAQEYITDIKNSEAEENNLKAQKRALEDEIYDRVLEPILDDEGQPVVNQRTGEPRTIERLRLKDKFKNNPSEEDRNFRKQKEQEIAACEDAMIENKAERVDAYKKMFAAVSGGLEESARKAREFRENKLAHENEIRHMANSDLEGIEAPVQETKEQKAEKKKDPFKSAKDLVMGSFPSFNELLRFFGRKAIDGKGNLWNYFFKKMYIDAQEAQFRGETEAFDKIDNEVKEIFGDSAAKYPKIQKATFGLKGNIQRLSDLFEVEKQLPTHTISIIDGNAVRDRELTQGQMMYVYMVNKMADGRMKLRAMGITDEVMEELEDALDPRFKALADWIQGSFLPGLRTRYNAVHERMFGAPMAAIDDYITLKVAKNAIPKEVDPSISQGEQLPSELTGNIIKRKRNALPIDLSVDGIDMVIEHVKKMEHWAAFAEMSRDLKTLLSYNTFKNKVRNMSSVRFGTGDKLWDNLLDASKLAIDAFRPSVRANGADRTALNVAKGVTAAKINLRLFTAAKQLTSYPAYLSEATAKELAKTTLNPLSYPETWDWAINNLPGFKKRFESRFAGETRLQENEDDWALWDNMVVKWFMRNGMMPNAFVDAFTVAIGAKAIYETKKKQYLKYGMSEERANDEALRDASIAYNETQQSSEGGYTSLIQNEGTWLSSALTIFRNASMGYGRRQWRAVNELAKKLTPGFKKESIDKMTEMYMRSGLDEDVAKARAEAEYNKSWRSNITDILVFGYGLQWFWNMSSYMWYMMFGDDDDKKKEFMKDVFLHSLFGSVEGLAGGSNMSELLNALANVLTDKNDDKAWWQKLEDYDFTNSPLVSDMQSVIRHFRKDYIQGISDIIEILAQSATGIKPETLTRIVSGIIEGTNGDPRIGHEIAFVIGELMNVPKSQLRELYLDELEMTGEEASEATIEELAQRYADIQRRENAPLAEWIYRLDEDEKATVDEKAIKKFMENAKERLSKDSPEELKEIYKKAYENHDIKLKELVDKTAYKKEGLKDQFSKQNLELWEGEYLRLRSWEDMMEDIVLEKEYKRAKDKGDTEREEQIKYVRKDLNAYRRELDDPDQQERNMKELRKDRKDFLKALKEHPKGAVPNW